MSSNGFSEVQCHDSFVEGAGCSQLEALNKQYRRALVFNPCDGEAWRGLADCVSYNSEVTLPDGRTVTRTELYMEAVRHAPRDTMAWKGLGNCLPLDDEVQLLDGSKITKMGAYKRSISEDPSNAMSWTNLGSCMSEDGTVIVVGKEYTKLECYLESLARDSSVWYAWNNIAVHMAAHNKDTIQLRDGQTCDYSVVAQRSSQRRSLWEEKTRCQETRNTAQTT